LPRQDHVLITTEQLIRVHINELDNMLCKLDSAKYARPHQPNSSLPEVDKEQRGFFLEINLSSSFLAAKIAI